MRALRARLGSSRAHGIRITHCECPIERCKDHPDHHTLPIKGHLSWYSSPSLHYCRFCIQKWFNRVPCINIISCCALVCPVLSSTGRRDVETPVTVGASSVMMLLFTYMFLF